MGFWIGGQLVYDRQSTPLVRERVISSAITMFQQVYLDSIEQMGYSHSLLLPASELVKASLC